VAAFAHADVPDVQPPTFLMIGRLILEKGVIDFVEAARRVRFACPGVRFVLVGGLDPKPGSLTKEDVRAWVAEGIIEWAGEVGDVRPFLREASAFVLPSYREGVPRSTQEAMAIGRAVITTDVPGCRVTVRDGVNGFLVPPRDPEALARAMMRFVHDRELAVTMGAESRRIAEADFDVHVVNARLLGYMNLSNRLVAGAGEPQQAIRSD
jgi:glycosyltransferase involved in cell wall biosynthesis